MRASSTLLGVTAASWARLTSSQQLAQDPGVTGPPLEVVHLYNDLYPIGRF